MNPDTASQPDSIHTRPSKTTVLGHDLSDPQEQAANADADARYSAADDIASTAVRLHDLWQTLPRWQRPSRAVRRAVLAAYADAARTAQAGGVSGYVSRWGAVPSVDLQRLSEAAEAGSATLEPAEAVLGRRWLLSDEELLGMGVVADHDATYHRLAPRIAPALPAASWLARLAARWLRFARRDVDAASDPCRATEPYTSPTGITVTLRCYRPSVPGTATCSGHAKACRRS